MTKSNTFHISIAHRRLTTTLLTKLQSQPSIIYFKQSHFSAHNFVTLLKTRVSKFAVENVFNRNATIIVLNSTKTTAINDNEKNLAKNEEKLTSS